jgi:NADPH:quinone reductase-like Zn-dependent oxidoreductase
MLAVSPFVSQTMGFFLAHQRKPDLAVLREMLESGKVTPVIDRTYPFDEIASAMAYLEEGHAAGKIIITM